jgi:flagellar motor switch protein FliN
VDLLVNGKRIARGEVVAIDEEFGLRITEVTSPEQTLEAGASSPEPSA